MSKKKKQSTASLRKKEPVRHQINFDASPSFVAALEKLKKSKKMKAELKGRTSNHRVLGFALKLLMPRYTS